MIVHIGYHKTGTTYLQNNIFPKLLELDYRGYEDSKVNLKPVYQASSFEFEKLKISLINNPNTLYSFEGLVGEIGLGVYNKEIADRLKMIGFQKIIITIRRQDKMLESLYRQYIQRGGLVSPNSFLNDNRFLHHSYLYYYELINYYQSLFGKENVLVLVYEELLQTPQDFINKICDFCNVSRIKYTPQKANKSLSKSTLILLRFINHFTHNHFKQSNLISDKITTWRIRFLLNGKFDNIIRGVFGNGNFYSENTKSKFLTYYGESNKQLNNLINEELSNFGYF